jgi:hypothetical protein
LKSATQLQVAIGAPEEKKDKNVTLLTSTRVREKNFVEHSGGDHGHEIGQRSDRGVLPP